MHDERSESRTNQPKDKVMNSSLTYLRKSIVPSDGTYVEHNKPLCSFKEWLSLYQRVHKYIDRSVICLRSKSETTRLSDALRMITHAD